MDSLAPPRASRTPTPLSLYLAAICLVGIPALFLTIARGLEQIFANETQIAVLAPLIIIGELIPIRVPRGDDYEELTVSTTFAFALLLIGGPAAAMLAMAAASLISDVVRHRPASRGAFNVAQYSLSILAATTVLGAFEIGPLGSRPVQLADLGAFITAGAAFFVVNDVLPGIAHALFNGLQGRKIIAFLVEDIPFQAGTAAALISMAPLVASAANDSPLLVVLLAAPLVAVYRAAAALARTSHEALHDSLTGLANRVQLYRTMREKLDDSGTLSRPFALCLLDLDRFKEVNDSLGHAVGDELLRTFADRLRGAIGGDDLVARLGGDEFAILLAEADTVTARAEAQRLGSLVGAPFELSTVTLDVAASIGVALAPEHGDDIESLLRAADAACYRAKAARSGFLIYDPAISWEHRSRKPLLADLHRAVEAGEFVAFYQPKANTHTRQIFGVETLLRWQHPIHGLLNPMEFLALLNHSGVIRQVTSDLIDTTLAQLASWRDQGFELHAAVNLSMHNLHDPLFAQNVAERLAHHRIAPWMFELEVTERTIMADPQRVTACLGELKDVGVTIALDDFGTGYSSLAHLSTMPLDVLKIDQAFVRNLAANPKDAVIVRSTIELARNLELSTVAEGVEDELTWTHLDRLGCDAIQGYIISRPTPADELTRYLHQLPALTVPRNGAQARPDPARGDQPVRPAQLHR